MRENIIIAGAGGQGIMVFGRVLAEAAMLENKQVTWLPSYGAEVRGGTAFCMVNISEEEISSPFIQRPDTLIIMNAPSLKKFAAGIQDKGLLIANSSLVKGKVNSKAKVLQYPFSEIAIKLGNIKVANMVALGCLIGAKKIVRPESVLKVISSLAPKKELVEINQKAFLYLLKRRDK